MGGNPIFLAATSSPVTIDTRRRTIEARLVAEVWIVRHGGGHDIYKHPDRPGRIVLPRHRTLSVGVAWEIAETAGWR